jgi:hypothetical protein
VLNGVSMMFMAANSTMRRDSAIRRDVLANRIRSICRLKVPGTSCFVSPVVDDRQAGATPLDGCSH